MARATFLVLITTMLLGNGAIQAADEVKKAPPADAKKDEVKKDEVKKEPPADAKKLGSDDAGWHTHSRAGYPQCVSRLAQPTDSCGYCGYYVGGGSARWSGLPAPSCTILGTWGRDWCGCCFHPTVMLGWAGRYQGGTGSYRTGSRDLPDPVAGLVILPEVVHQKRQEKYCGPEEH